MGKGWIGYVEGSEAQMGQSISTSISRIEQNDDDRDTSLYSNCGEGQRGGTEGYGGGLGGREGCSTVLAGKHYRTESRRTNHSSAGSLALSADSL